VKNLGDGLMLSSSKIGHFLSGTCKTSLTTMKAKEAIENPSISSTVIECCHYDEQEFINKKIEDFFSLESIGISLSDLNFDEDKHVLNSFEKSISFNGERYEICLPWLDPMPELPSNYGLAYGRLKSLVNQYHTNYDILVKYQEIINDQLNRNMIEEVVFPLDSVDGPMHYLAHQPVVKTDKTFTKVRIVFDASAKLGKNGRSLNSCFFKGPDLSAGLIGMLIRARFTRILICCDVEKAFLQISITKTDRDAMRFLFLRDFRKPISPSNLICYRFKVLPFGLKPSPFVLQATIQYHARQVATDVSEEISRNIYMDNAFIQAESAHEGYEKCLETKKFFKLAGMNVREFCSNDNTIIEKLPVEDRDPATSHKLLGIKWNIEADSMIFCLPNKPVEGGWTKRGVLSTMASLFDPMGLIDPIRLPAKLLLQKIWLDNESSTEKKSKKNWDAPLPSKLIDLWEEILEDWNQFPSFTIPRFVGHSDSIFMELHAFCDASSLGFATAIYARFKSKNVWFSKLIFAKTRVKPTSAKYKKVDTIPRLELLAAICGVRALKFVASELHGYSIKSFVWTDSQCVFHWIKSPRKLNRFEENRVREIRDLSTTIRFVSTEDNPADIGSRGCSPTELNNSKIWWSGPEWLNKEEIGWPETNFVFRTDEYVSEENDGVIFESSSD
jgi:hypothetical protein